MSAEVFRIHPAIGIARVGNSDEFYLAPETAAGLPQPGGGAQTGGLPIVAGTEAQTITDRDLRDGQGRFKKQAARFRVYHYPDGAPTYPSGGGTEVTLGSVIGGRTVTDIVWTVHLANKKANCYELPEPAIKGVTILDFYADCKTPTLRNVPPDEGTANAPPDEFKGAQCSAVIKGLGTDIDSAERRTKLQIDPGPRAIQASAGEGTVVSFDAATVASYWQAGDGITENPDYPQSFPSMHFDELSCPEEGIVSLGALRTEANGRLLVVPANGTACSFTPDCALGDDVNNDGWFDDVADGPVWATLVFDDGGTVEAQGAWVVTTDPGYAPQTLNVVSLWDDIYETFVEQLGLVPSLFSGGQYQAGYQPSFQDDVYPVFRGAWMQQWNTALPQAALAGHESVNDITPDDDPARYLDVQSIIRNPNEWEDQSEIGSPRMPLSLGDSGMSFLMVTKTQYFFLTQWFAGTYSKQPGPPPGQGELLDRVTLVNCLGGRYSPGIDMTFIVRQAGLWKADWQQEGPFRINAQKLDYSQATKDQPFLTAGWFPLRTADCPPASPGIEPGDTSKFMALPWHTDYNSCATHLPSPNPVVSETGAKPVANLTLYWSWPAQRPVSVYVAADVSGGKLAPQRFSVRGEGTGTTNPAQVGRYQDRLDMVKNWHRIGVVIQATAIEGVDGLPDEVYLEVASQLDDSGNTVVPWPNTVRDTTKPTGGP